MSPFSTLHSQRFALEAARAVCVRLSDSVCQSVCLGRAGHTDERTHDVNDAVSTGRRNRRRERINFYRLRNIKKPGGFSRGFEVISFTVAIFDHFPLFLMFCDEATWFW